MTDLINLFPLLVDNVNPIHHDIFRAGDEVGILPVV